MTDQFSTFYYTDAFISDRRTLSLLSILSDSVYLYYLSPDYFLKPLEERWDSEKEQPFFKRAPVETALITSIHHQKHLQFITENRELVNAGVIHPILVAATPPDWEDFQQYEQEMMDHYKGIAFGLWGTDVGLIPEAKNMVYVDAPHFALYRWQSLSGALYFAIKANITPISDNPTLSAIACEAVTSFSPVNPIEYTSKDLSKLLGFKVLSSALPNFGELQAEQILELRDYLCHDLEAFRREMYQAVLKWKADPSNLDEIVESNIQPKLDDIKLKIASSRRAFIQKLQRTLLATGTSATLLTQFVTLPIHHQIAVGIGLIAKTLIDYAQFRDHKEEILSDSENKGLVLLLELEKYGKRHSQRVGRVA